MVPLRRCLSAAATACGLGLALWAGTAAAVVPMVPAGKTIQIADGVYVIPDQRISLVPNVGIIVGGAGGVREHTQRIGRVLRPRPGKRAKVYELVTRGTAEMAQARRRRHGLGGSLGSGAL